MTSNEFTMAQLLLQDHLRINAAGKVQRWDVVKWVITANLALAAVSVSLHDPKSSKLLMYFSVLILAIGIALVLHYNKRMTGARNDAGSVYRYLQDNQIDLKKIAGKDLTMPVNWLYDRWELTAYSVVALISWVPVLLTGCRSL
jgi:hypothetical protein